MPIATTGRSADLDASGGADDASRARVRTLFLGSGYAGHRTRFANLRRHLEHDPRLHASWRLVTGWNPDGLLERFPGLPDGISGRVRAASEALPLLGWPRPDVIWSSAGSTDLAPFAWSFGGPLRRPFVLDLDWTLEVQELLLSLPGTARCRQVVYTTHDLDFAAQADRCLVIADGLIAHDAAGPAAVEWYRQDVSARRQSRHEARHEALES